MTRTQRLVVTLTLFIAALPIFFSGWRFTSDIEEKYGQMLPVDVQFDKRSLRSQLNGRRFLLAGEERPYRTVNGISATASGTPDYGGGLTLTFSVLLIGGSITVFLPELAEKRLRPDASRNV